MITKIGVDIAAIGIMVGGITLRTSAHPVGIIGWIKQARFIIAQITKIERILALITLIVAEIALLPAVALTSVITQLVNTLNTLRNQCIAEAERYLHAVLDELSPGNLSIIEDIQIALQDVQAISTETGLLLRDVQALNG